MIGIAQQQQMVDLCFHFESQAAHSGSFVRAAAGEGSERPHGGGWAAAVLRRRIAADSPEADAALPVPACGIELVY